MPSDICLLLEGTYPYVAGGVSTWVAQILQAMPDLRFSILFIGPSSKQPLTPKYDLPRNVVEVRTAFVHDYPPLTFADGQRAKLCPAAWRALAAFQEAVLKGEAANLVDVCRAVAEAKSDEHLIAALAHSRQAWEQISGLYKRYAPEGFPFLDFFWTHRFIYIPALRLLRTPLPAARVYHAASTGYAGLLGARAARIGGAPLIITEHGIYTRERRLEIFNAEWIRERESDPFLDMQRRGGFTRQWWIRFFESLSRIAYGAAQHITSLFTANVAAQIKDGADAERTEVIPNGIDPRRYLKNAPRSADAGAPFHIGFIGRIAAIKDVKTLLRALAILRSRQVAFRAFLLGPLDEEEDYAADCQRLAKALDLEGWVMFQGQVDVLEWLPRLDVVVLTSISEGQPFVILEAGAAGLPVIATDVGACREMLLGRPGEDASLGPSGLVTAVASPAETAAALEMLARDPALRRRLGENARRRVLRFYDLTTVMRRYRDLYERYLYDIDVPFAPERERWQA
ncbi:MAG: GT4 family glycosyltransferase PelF [Planctomycetota bacterium]|nr:GT4 family glycosyltransferase PelF [Planctomycetota bacterium]